MELNSDLEREKKKIFTKQEITEYLDGDKCWGNIKQSKEACQGVACNYRMVRVNIIEKVKFYQT